jgi:hypothetical protein
MVPFKEDGKVPRTFPEERGERKQYALAAMGKARVFYLFFGRYESEVLRLSRWRTMNHGTVRIILEKVIC